MSSPVPQAIATARSPVSPHYRRLVLGLGVLAMIVCYAVWPYQHWQFADRQSVLAGWWKVLSLDVNAEWQFCYIVPLITGFLVYRQRDVLRQLPLQGTWIGIPVLLFGTFLYWMGYKVDTGYVGYAALQLHLAGLILLLGGWNWMKVLFVPWIFLGFAWPLFPLDNLLAARLKIPTAFIAEQMLSLMGIGVVREGSTLQSAADFVIGLRQGDRFTLDVADSCSGMRSLYALMMVGVLYSVIGLRRTTPRIILALSAIPLAVVGNVVRLILLTLGSILISQEWAVGRRVGDQQEESFFHILAGFMVFGVALAGMFALATWLEGRHWKRLHLTGAAPGSKPAEDPTGDLPRRALTKAGIGFAVLCLGMPLCWMSPQSMAYAEMSIIPELPATVGDYHGLEKEMSYKERVAFDPGVLLKRREYTSSRGRQIMGTLVVSGPIKKSLHTPELCLPDQGWTITSTETVPVRLPNGQEFSATLMRVFRDAQVSPGERIRLKAMNLVWYIGNHGVSTPSFTMSHYYGYRDAIFFNFNHRWSQAAFFMPVSYTKIGAEDPLQEVLSMQELLDFAGQAAPFFMITPKNEGAVATAH